MHLAAWDDVRAREVRRISAGYESAWRVTADQDAVYSALVHDLRRGLTPGQAKWELAESHQGLVEAIAAATARGLDAPLCPPTTSAASRNQAERPMISRP